MSIVNAMAHLYDQLSEKYDQFSEIPRDIADQLLARLDWIKLSPKKIIDVGCGTGYCAQHLSSRYPDADVIALDVSQGMLSKVDGVHTLQADAMHLPYEDQSVDLVVSNLFLDCYIDMRAFFSEIQRVLTAGGIFLFTTLGEGSFLELKQSAVVIDRASHVNPFCQMQEVVQCMQQSGFVDPVVDHDLMTVLYDNWAELIKELKALGSVHWLSTARSGLMTPRQLMKWQAEYQAQSIDGLLPVSLVIIFGHGCGRGPVSKKQEISISLDEIRRR